MKQKALSMQNNSIGSKSTKNFSFSGEDDRINQDPYGLLGR